MKLKKPANEYTGSENYGELLQVIANVSKPSNASIQQGNLN